MAALTVHRNPNPATRKRIPFLVDLQSDLLVSLETRMVAPLYAKTAIGPLPMLRLTPVVLFQGHEYLVMIPEMAGVPRRSLGVAVGDLSHLRGEIIAALDLLFTGF